LGQLASVLPANEAVLHLLNAAVSFLAVTVAFTAIYKVMPEVPPEWPDVILGAAVTAILFALGNFLLGLYLGKVSFSSTYGAASLTIVLAIRVYYSSQILSRSRIHQGIRGNLRSAPRELPYGGISKTRAR